MSRKAGENPAILKVGENPAILVDASSNRTGIAWVATRPCHHLGWHDAPGADQLEGRYKMHFKTLTLSAAFAVAGLASPWALADQPEQAESLARLSSFDQIQKQLDDSRLRLLDARPQADYEKSHIPGAIWVDVREVEKLSATSSGLADREAWEAWVSKLGIGGGTIVRICAGKQLTDAARVWWLLTYVGVADAGLIDGNFALWERQGRPVTEEIRPVEPKPFHVEFREERLATRAQVEQALKSQSAAIVDARSTSEFTGEQKRAKRGGRIPGACSAEWSKFVKEDGTFLDEETAREILRQSGLQEGPPLITHCQTGGRASVTAFVLERLGYPTRNYYLGWNDWGNAEDTPVEISDPANEKP